VIFMKVFWQLGKTSKLTPKAGDCITELNSIAAVSKFAKVKYGGIPRGCDIYYIRANPVIANKVNDGKLIYFASPTNKAVYNKADYIATFTDAWTQDMKNNDARWKLTTSQKKKLITVHQTIHPRFVPLQNHPKTKAIRAKIGGKFIIGHFGAVRPSCYPHTFLRLVEEIKTCYPWVNIVFAGGNLQKKWISDMKFNYEEMPFAISACDLILYNMWTEDAHIAGSMKILEAMACGVPVLCPRLKAREFELGKDYPLFHDWWKTPNGYFGPHVEAQMLDLLEFAINDPKQLKKIGERCHQKSKFFGINQSSARLKKLFTKIMKE